MLRLKMLLVSLVVFALFFLSYVIVEAGPAGISPVS